MPDPFAILYAPPGVRLAFRLGPPRGDYSKALAEGLKPVPPVDVTTDVQNAMTNNKIALRTYSVSNDLVWVGEHVVMFVSRSENYPPTEYSEAGLEFFLLGVGDEEFFLVGVGNGEFLLVGYQTT